MKASELRIGNYVLISTGNHLVKVPSYPEKVCGITVWGELDFKGGNGNRPGYKVPAIHCTGVPLTEEWLEKFGFSISWDRECNFRAILGDFELCCGDAGECYNFLTINNRHGKNRIQLQVKYVHQLQNLYFILMDRELNDLNEGEAPPAEEE